MIIVLPLNMAIHKLFTAIGLGIGSFEVAAKMLSLLRLIYIKELKHLVFMCMYARVAEWI